MPVKVFSSVQKSTEEVGPIVDEWWHKIGKPHECVCEKANCIRSSLFALECDMRPHKQ